MALSFSPIRSMLATGASPASRWFSYIGLCLGVLLLLCSVQMFWNVQELLGKKMVRKDGYDYISVTKTITNETMGQPEKNLFHEADITDLKKQPFADDVAPLMANQFRVQLSAGQILAFKTDLFLESIDQEFLDTVPPTYHWEEGSLNVPLILSSDFLEAYNVFAPGQGLPQVSQKTALAIPVVITCSGNGRQASFQGNVVAFSDRINSVLVPQNFLSWANKNFGVEGPLEASRVFIKTKDASSQQLISYLDAKKYSVNKDKTKFGRTRQIIQGILSGLGVFGLLVVVLALLLFSFYLQLVIARSKSNIDLLLQLGYAPAWLSKKLAFMFLPAYIIIVFMSLAFAQCMQWAFQHYVFSASTQLSIWLHWSVYLVAGFLALLSVITTYRLVVKQISTLG